MNRRAFDWYQKAAEQGHAMAQYNLGMRYAEGTGLSRNFSAPAHGLLWQQHRAMKSQKEHVEVDAKLALARRGEGQQLAASWKNARSYKPQNAIHPCLAELSARQVRLASTMPLVKTCAKHHFRMLAASDAPSRDPI